MILFLAVPLAITLAILATVLSAHAFRVVSTTDAARILIGIPLLIVAAADVGVAVMLIANGHEVGAFFVQTPTLIVVLAFAGTLRPSYEWVIIQALVCILMLFASLIFILTAGIFIFMLDVLIFVGMVYTASAARRGDHRNDAYWQHYFSRHA